jgi:hypothetical protein
VVEFLCKKAFFDYYKLEGEVDRLRREGKEEQAKEKYVEAFYRVRDTMPDQSARILFKAGEWAPPGEAVEYFQTFADLSISRRDFQSAVTALERALECCSWSGNRGQIEGIEERIEAVKEDMPHNLDECFAELKRLLTPEQLQTFKNHKHLGDILEYHWSLGRWIRESWGLWHNSQLAEYLERMGISQPDNMSTKILWEFNRHLNRESDE